MRRLLVFLALPALLIAVAGCGGDTTDTPRTTIDLTQLLTILPTPVGFDQATSEIRTATAADVQATFARTPKPDVAAEFERLGFEAAALRHWRGPNGADAVIVASRWQDHLTATNVGAGPSQLLIGGAGATAWTPSSLPGARGVQVTGSNPTRLLSIAIDDVSVFMRVDGPADPEALVRTLDLCVQRLRSAGNPA